MYYVYEFYIIDTGEVIYAGKGKGRRYKVTSQRNELLTEMLAKHHCESRIVKTFENEEDAFSFEFEYINELRARGQCICNIYSGGAGGSGEYWTDDLRKEYSEKNIMKSPEQRKRMSANNPMKNPEIAKKTNGQKRRAVIIGDKEYASVTEAHQALGVAIDSVILWCKKGINHKGEKCRYKDEEQVVFTGKRYNKGSCRSLTYKGKHYESPLDLAEELGCSPTTIYEWAKRGFSPEGVSCKYDDDTRVLEFENRYVKRNKARAKRVIVNGVLYRSCSEASKSLGIPKTTLYSYLQNAKHNSNYICKYEEEDEQTIGLQCDRGEK